MLGSTGMPGFSSDKLHSNHQNDGKVTVTSILNERLAIAILEK
jgi:hypothetical protein